MKRKGFAQNFTESLTEPNYFKQTQVVTSHTTKSLLLAPNHLSVAQT